MHMAKLIIEGGKPLKGAVKISGNKNSILPCLAACLLTDGEVILENASNISDVWVMIDILRFLGAKVSFQNHQIKVMAKKLKTYNLPDDLTSKLRASVLLVGPLLSRMGHVNFSHPGGDVIGKRSIGVHIKGFEALGCKFKTGDRKYKGGGPTFAKASVGKEVFLEEPSVTATENLVMFAVLGKSDITLKNCAQEPHVVDLCNLLTKMGAQIEGIGTNILKIKGVKKLGGATFKIGPDYIEMGTYAVAAAITKGAVKLTNCSQNNLEPIFMPLEKMGLKFVYSKNQILVFSKGIKSIPVLKTNIWPGFPTDLMSVLIVLATQASGVSLLHDWMYESRIYFTDKLLSMGANITIADPHRVLVSGPSKLYGRELETPDIRAGMALVLAALMAEGKSTIYKCELIERGYEDVVGNLRRLGARIRKVP